MKTIRQSPNPWHWKRAGPEDPFLELLGSLVTTELPIFSFPIKRADAEQSGQTRNVSTVPWSDKDYSMCLARAANMISPRETDKMN